MIWIKEPSAKLNKATREAALTRQSILTKPPGSLGQLEEFAVWLAERQASETPAVDKVWISVFAGDHGVMAENVSAFPQVVTGEMIKNFASGGAAISVMARSLGAKLEVINLGVVNDPGEIEGVVYAPIAAQTANIAEGAAMTESQLSQALWQGGLAAERAQENGSQLMICGDMGIGNTTASAALACACLGLPPEQLVGPGTGVDSDGVALKARVVSRALRANRSACNSSEGILQSLGGFEIAAITGAMISAAQLGLPVLVDGYITTTAALVAVRINPSVRDWLHFSHRSAEPGHVALLEALDADTLIDLNMRLGEASGAAVSVPLLRLACGLHNNMATFAEAGVSTE